MSKKKVSIINVTNDLLMSTNYVNDGRLIIVYNNSKRVIFPKIAFFELVYQGEDLYLNISKHEEDVSYSEKIDLSTVNNINSVPISSVS